MLWAILLVAQDFSFAPPDAAFLASLNVGQVRGLVQELAREAGVKSPVSWRVLDRVERVQVAVAIRDKEPQVIALLEGNFRADDVAELRKASTGKDAMQVEMLDERRILITDRSLVRGIPIRTFQKAIEAQDTRPKFAVVHGMDGGPKEIPVQ